MAFRTRHRMRARRPAEPARSRAVAKAPTGIQALDHITGDEDYPQGTDIGMSSFMDTWLLLRNLVGTREAGGASAERAGRQ